MRKPSSRRPRPHDRGFYREIDGPAGLVESARSTGLSHSSSSAIAALSRRQGVLGPELPPVGGTGGLRHRGPRRRDRRGAVAAAARAPPASPATRPGATCPTRTAFTWGRGRPPSVDLDLNLVFVGTSVTSPAPKFLRGASRTHLYHNSDPRPRRSPSTPTRRDPLDTTSTCTTTGTSTIPSSACSSTPRSPPTPTPSPGSTPACSRARSGG